MTDAVSRAWRAVEREGERLGALTLRELFDRDPERFATLSFRHEDLLVDLSKEKIDRPALDALLALAGAAELPAWRDDLFTGKHVNATEGRAALHMALRGGTDPDVAIDGAAVLPEVEAVRERFLAFADGVRSGRYARGTALRSPTSSTSGSAAPTSAPRWRSGRSGRTTTGHASTSSRTRTGRTSRMPSPGSIRPGPSSSPPPSRFTTLETMTNARSARRWLEEALGDRAGDHMAAISSNVEAAAGFGIEEERVFGFRDWVGGRYSLWSAIGLPLAIAIGTERFRELLAGAAAMDRHFRDAPLERNLPVLMGLVSVWRRNAMGCPCVALIPYDQRLERFPAYVQQLAMESNGKRVARDGTPAARPTAPVIWGEPGTNAQHSFFQFLHQGTDVVPVEFIIATEARNGAGGDHHRLLLASCLAQGQALAFGRTPDQARRALEAVGVAGPDADRLASHRSSPGIGLRRPSCTTGSTPGPSAG